MIPAADLRYECPDNPPGMRPVVVSAAVRIIHIPTGLVAESRHARSQPKNLAICLAMLEEALTNPELT